ncbi:hypothetical protein WDV06_29695 [Streptomyces racemochromogenes]|uniref:Sensor domain-containing protein n=1 Tax=Streptomyces racemochromogenes TaxID=67353 RepID=A0ABW7PLE3_9ACTN
MTHSGIRNLAGAVLLVAVAGCASTGEPRPSAPAAPPAPLSAAELRTHLLPAVLPGGWTSRAEPADSGPKASATSVPPASCGGLLDGQSVVDASTTAASANATAMFGGGRSAGNGVIPGMEKLYAFPGDGARRAMEDIRALVGRCPSVELPHTAGETADFALADGPRLGDESLVVQARVMPGGTERADATVVRVGSALVVLSSVLTLAPAEAGTVAGFMPAAVAQLASDHPEPVG